MLMRQFAPLLIPFLATALAADMPVREVILYKSGVGYFARSGQLPAGDTARLDFKATDMNDVLKSLTVADDSGAPIRGLRYDSSTPLAQKLAEFPFTVSNGQQMSAFVDHLRGARIELKLASETLAGTIVSARTIASDLDRPEREQLILLLDSGDLRTVDLGAVSTLRFPDAKLQAQLKDYLGTVAQSRSKDLRSVYIDSAATKGRAVSASYMIPQPLWKSSYRLLFDEKGEATLEGWAIVDNTTGDDWTNVHLSVVSGRPVSFISHLYEPFYVQRTTADVDNAYAQAPVMYDAAVSNVPNAGLTMTEQMGMSSKTTHFDRNDGTHLGTGSGGNAARGVYRVAGQPSSIAPSAATQELGDLFEYRFDAPVTIRKNESAMLPFLQQKIAARKLLIYAESYGQNPMSAAELTNNTAKTLDGGPITIFENASYGGEALMNTTKNADKRLISYAVDLGTRIGTLEGTSNQHILEVHANRGVVTTKSSSLSTKTYTIHNVDARAKTLIIEQPIRSAFTPVTPKPTETTATAHRYEVKLAAGATEKFPVVEEYVFWQSTQVSSFTPDLLVEFVSQKAISDTGLRQLQQIIDQKARIAETDAALQTTHAEMEQITHAQDRLRQNINTLNNVNGQQDQVQKWSRQLGDEEVRITALRDKANGLEQQKTAQQAELNDMIGKLEF